MSSQHLGEADMLDPRRMDAIAQSRQHGLARWVDGSVPGGVDRGRC